MGKRGQQASHICWSHRGGPRLDVGARGGGRAAQREAKQGACTRNCHSWGLHVCRPGNGLDACHCGVSMRRPGNRLDPCHGWVSVHRSGKGQGWVHGVVGGVRRPRKWLDTCHGWVSVHRSEKGLGACHCGLSVCRPPGEGWALAMEGVPKEFIGRSPGEVDMVQGGIAVCASGIRMCCRCSCVKQSCVKGLGPEPLDLHGPCTLCKLRTSMPHVYGLHGA